ncbi:MAG: hypothetical protein HRU41_15190 [Saprospiraceae bacterium]|nr:hypothetical protein [Saprospiraceae bacterium]
MEEEKDELAKFIRNRLVQSDDADDDWDLPDLEVWRQAKEQIANQVTVSEKRDRKWAILWFTLALLLSSLLYIGYLTRKNQNLIKQVQEQAFAMVDLQDHNHELSRQLAAVLPTPNLKEEVDLSAITAKVSPNRLHQKVKLMDVQEPPIQPQMNSGKEPSHGDLKVTAPEKSLEYPIQVETKPLNPALLMPERHLLSQTEFLRVLPFKSRQWAPSAVERVNENNWEIGVHLGLSSLQILTAANLGKEDNEVEQLEQTQTETFHLHLAYSSKTNWWIKAGVQYGEYAYENSYQLKTEYDESKEYTKPDGTVVNTVQLRTSYANLGGTQQVEIDVPDDADLKTGDLTLVDVFEKQRIKAWQFPISLEYRLRNKRLGWQLHAGLLASFWTLEWAEAYGTFESSKYESAIKFEEKLLDSKTTQMLLGIQGGMGVHYQMSQRLHLRADLLFQYQKEAQRQNVELGIGYQF